MGPEAIAYLEHICKPSTDRASYVETAFKSHILSLAMRVPEMQAEQTEKSPLSHHSLIRKEAQK